MADEYINKVEVGAKIQMMYIRREMDYGGENEFCRGMRKALRVIENMPTADVQPVEHGHWEEHEIRGSLTQCCSVCGSDCGVLYPYRYCPCCGARMDGDTE